MMALSLIYGGQKAANQTDSITVSFPELDLPPSPIWLAPIRTKTKRTYDQLYQELFSPEGARTPYLIRRMLRSRTSGIKFRKFLEQVGKSSGLFQTVTTKDFGRNSNAPFELDIILDGKALNISNVGYGVSQALPVIVEIVARQPHSWFAIQQPEVHLHPRAQAALGDLFFELAVEDNKSFVV